MAHRFDPAKLEKLNDPVRLIDLDPGVMWSLVGAARPRIVVEIGAGTGIFAVEFARRMEGGTLYAVDVAEQMVDWMQRHLPDDVRSTVVPLKTGGDRMPLPGCSADLVYMINVHHELDEPADTLKESLRLLRSGGHLLVVDWKAEETPKGPPVDFRIPADRIVAQVRAAGFQEVASHDVLRYHSVVTATKG